MVSKSAYSSILSIRTKNEIIKSWEWYEERQRGLGDRFVKEVVSHYSENRIGAWQISYAVQVI